MTKSLLDSHAHLGLCDDPALAVASAAEHGVSHILAVGFDLETSRQAVRLANRFPHVKAAVGIHPNDATRADTTAFAEIAALARDPEVIAIGETGLDYYHERSPRDVQWQAFERHISLARESGLSLIVHCREASDDTMELLGSQAGDLRVIMHCFSLYEHLEECGRRGYYMSIAGNVTFPKAVELREAAAKIPDRLLLTETDAPWLTPVPFRGKPNEPAHIRFIVEELARLRGTAPGDLARQVLSNYRAAFLLSE